MKENWGDRHERINDIVAEQIRTEDALSEIAKTVRQRQEEYYEAKAAYQAEVRAELVEFFERQLAPLADVISSPLHEYAEHLATNILEKFDVRRK